MTLQLVYHDGILTIWQGEIHHATYTLPHSMLGEHYWFSESRSDHLPGDIIEKIAELLKQGGKNEETVQGVLQG